MLGQRPVKIEDYEFFGLLPLEFPDSRHQVQHRLRLVRADVIDMVAHGEVSQIVTIHWPKDCLEPGFMSLVQKMGPIHNDTHVVRDSRISPGEKILGRVGLAAGNRDHFSAFPEPQDLVAKMLAEGDESDLVVHVHLVAEGDNLFCQSRFPLFCRMGFKFEEEHQGDCFLRLGEIFPKRRDLIPIRQRAGADGLVIKFLDIRIVRTGDLRAMKDHKRVIRREMDVQLDSLDSQLLRSAETCQSVLKRARMGVITSVGHDLGLSSKHGGDSQKGYHK